MRREQIAHLEERPAAETPGPPAFAISSGFAPSGTNIATAVAPAKRARKYRRVEAPPAIGSHASTPRTPGSVRAASASRGAKSGSGACGVRGLEADMAFGLAAGRSERYHCESMVAKLGPLVARAAAGLGAHLGAPVEDAIRVWLERLQEWNARIDLTAARSPDELVDLMLADALVLAARVPHGARVVDVGTGAGAPGLALALLRGDLRVTLVEPLAKRTSFLRTVLGALGRTDVVLERARGEALVGRRAWDMAVSRATLAPPAWLDLGTTLTAPGGVVWVLLAKDSPPMHPRAEVDGDHAYVWPLTGVERRAVAYRVGS